MTTEPIAFTGFDTLALHAGQVPDPTTAAVSAHGIPARIDTRKRTAFVAGHPHTMAERGSTRSPPRRPISANAGAGPVAATGLTDGA